MVAFVPAMRYLFKATQVYIQGMEQLAPGAVYAPLYYGVNLPSVSSGGITIPDTFNPPVTSATRMRGQVKKQMRSTSHKHSPRRKKYAYGKRKRY